MTGVKETDLVFQDLEPKEKILPSLNEKMLNE